MPDPTAIPTGPLTQSDGTISHSWLRYFDANWRKLGGFTHNAPVNSTNITGILASLNLNANGVLNSTNFCTVDSIDNGTDATIRVYGTGGIGTTWTRQVGSIVQGPYPALSAAGYAYNTDYYTMFDPATDSFNITENFADILPDNFFWCGKVHTVQAGGAGGSTGGGGTGGGTGGVCFSGNTRVKTPDGPKQFYEMPTYPTLVTKFGPRPAKLTINSYTGPIHHMGNEELVTPRHPFERGEFIWIPARELFEECGIFTGHVYNAHILTDKEEERNYALENGEIVHNLSIL